MGKIRLHLVAAMLLTTQNSTLADWYSGDPYSAAPQLPLAAFYQPPLFIGRALETFSWPSGSGPIDRVGGHYYDFNNNSPANIAYWEIRTGVAPGNPGTLLYSGSGVPTLSPTSFSQGGWNISRIELDIPDFSLPAGNYFFSMSADPNWFVANTLGANSLNSAPADNSVIYSNTSNPLDFYYYKEIGTNGLGYLGTDPSYFITTTVPEPTSLMMVGAIGFVSWRRRR